jgi:hypothetical protein
MTMPSLETLAARLDVRAMALEEMARVLSAPQAAAVAAVLRDRVATAARDRVADPADKENPGAIDAAIASELAHLLHMLVR